MVCAVVVRTHVCNMRAHCRKCGGLVYTPDPLCEFAVNSVLYRILSMVVLAYLLSVET